MRVNTIFLKIPLKIVADSKIPVEEWTGPIEMV